MQMHMGHHSYTVGAKLGVLDGSQSSLRICVLHLKLLWRLGEDAVSCVVTVCSSLSECVYMEMSSAVCCSSHVFALTLVSRSWSRKDIAAARQGLRRAAGGRSSACCLCCSPRHTVSRCLTTRSFGKRLHLRGETWSEHSPASWPRQARPRVFSRMTSALSPVRVTLWAPCCLR